MCVFCKDHHHYIQACSKFLKLPVQERIEQIKLIKLCINCLRGNHLNKYCFSGHCRKCNGKHNTLLHIETQNTQKHENVEQTTKANCASTSDSEIVNYSSVDQVKTNSNILLSTALVQVRDKAGGLHTCRVLLDSASQSHFITNELCQKLNLPKTKIHISVVGINQVTTDINQQCTVNIESLHNAFSNNVTCLILPKINESLPIHPIDISMLNIPQHLKFGDPGFNECGKIDILLGAGIFYDLLIDVEHSSASQIG
ncbi:hypothetical protein JTB14_005227 [Gonioctena quinquepunctata]|nr:hypothetical protein JTB14_005227 [Gonioctena quinquepunctata]